MIQRTPDETRAEYQSDMGCKLGRTFYAMFSELGELHNNWGDYLELFGRSPERVDVLNKTAPSFFGRYQTVLWEHIIMHLARLTDSPKAMGRDNLSILALPDLIEDSVFAAQVQSLVDQALAKCDFVKSWRNNVLAHKDLDFALKRSTGRAVEPVSRLRVKQGIDSVGDVLIASSLN
jgi:hypothetical protein